MSRTEDPTDTLPHRQDSLQGPLEANLIELAERFNEPLPVRILIAASSGTAPNLDMENEVAVIKQNLLGLLIGSRLRDHFDVKVFRLLGDGQAQPMLGTHRFAATGPVPLPGIEAFDWVLFVLWHNLGPENALAALFERVRQVDVGLRTDAGKRFLVFCRQDSVPLDGKGFEDVRQRWEAAEKVRTFYATYSPQFPAQFEAYAGQGFELNFARAIRRRLAHLIERHAHDKGLRPAGEAVANAGNQPMPLANPYKGLEGYTRDDGVRFFGRIDEVDDLRERIAKADKGLLAVVGASGSGKSSLVRAGLFHRLALGAIAGSANWMVLETRVDVGLPSQKEALAYDIFDQWGKAGTRPEEMKRHTHLVRYLEDTKALGELVERLLIDRPQASRVLLFVDQFEELFTLIPDDKDPQRREYIDLLVRAAATPRLQVILAMRSDFYHRCIVYPQLRELFKTGVYPLTTPSVDALQSIIVRPALYNGFSFEDAGLPRRILQDAGVSSGALPLVSYTLAQLVERALAADRTELTHQDYEGLGCVAGIIQRQGDEAVANLRKEEGFEERFNAVFRNLVTVDDKGTATKRPAALSSIPPVARPIIDRLVDKRLLQASSAPTSDPVIEIAHEALLNHWDELKKWVANTRDALLSYRRVEAAAREWLGVRGGTAGAPATTLDTLSVDHRYLWGHERLSEIYAALEKLGLTAGDLEPAVRAFIRPEYDRLLDELEVEQVDHRRRAEIGDRLATLGDDRPGVGLSADGLPEFVWCKVPAGTVRVVIKENGDTREVERTVEHPIYIAQTPVTLRQFAPFIGNLQGHGPYEEAVWWQGLGEGADQWYDNKPVPQLPDLPNRPAQYVSWYQAIAYARWLTAQYQAQGLLPAKARVRLPTEWEWQQAATGGNPDYRYPWGTEWNPSYANNKEGLNQLVAVGLYPHGRSPVGALDMSGNVYEWCLNAFDDLNNLDETGSVPRTTRGGAWFTQASIAGEAREALSARSRLRDNANGKNDRGDRIIVGVRLVCDLAPKGAAVESNERLFGGSASIGDGA